MFCHLCSGAPRPSADRYGCSRRTTYNTVNDTIHEAPEKVDRHLTVTSHHQYHTLNCVCVCACCLQACRSTYKCVHVSHFCLDILAAVCWKAHFKEHNKTFFFFFFSYLQTATFSFKKPGRPCKHSQHYYFSFGADLYLNVNNTQG